jgi:hypothetical protein
MTEYDAICIHNKEAQKIKITRTILNTWKLSAGITVSLGMF